jgi:glycosyltransferase involved in cell wall biosynthesis
MMSIDILMITYNRPEYTRLSLTRLLETCDDSMRVWLWHNGTHEETLDFVHSFTEHPRVAHFHHSTTNERLRVPTNWLWEQAQGQYVSRVDDDCLVADGWAQKLREAHEDFSGFGVLGSWRYPDEDFLPELAERKIKEFPGGHRILQNFWVQGSGYLMKRRCIEEHGLLGEAESFSQYCMKLALADYVNGWYFPFIREEHMDDPRSPYTLLKTDADLVERLPLSARNMGAATLKQWTEQLRTSARRVQEASIDPRDYRGWRWRKRWFIRQARRRVRLHARALR